MGASACTLHISSAGSIRRRIAERPVNGTSLRKLKHPDYLTVSQANNIGRYRFKGRWLLYVPLALIPENSALCVYSSVQYKFSQYAPTIFLNSINRLVLYIRTEVLRIIYRESKLQILKLPSTPSTGTLSNGPLPVHIQLKRTISDVICSFLGNSPASEF